MLRTILCDRLGIEYPVILAGMGMKGRATPPRLVAAVSEAGGLGVIGASGLSPDALRAYIREVRLLTSKPFGVDVLLPASFADSSPDRATVKERLRREFPRHVDFVQRLIRDYGLTPVEPDGEVLSNELLAGQVDVVLDERVPVFAAGLGDPAAVVPRAHAVGTQVLGLAGNARNARRQVAAGVDFIVAQGSEAGGHTGRVATMPLIPQVVDAVSPALVIAASGIADGRGIVAALALGAVGVWVGTAFLVAEECEIYPAHQEQILGGGSEDFVVTRAYTGKTARDFHNDVINAWERSGLDALPMPLQGILIEDLVNAAAAAGRHDLINNPAGQAGGMVNQRRPAREILRSMVEDAEETAAWLASFRG
jgi:NAD(P)H-dependent flavin oxidoreductase YrpB (nitropropane dioxygenase family)